MKTKMKKVFCILLTLALVIGLNLVLPQTAKAATFQSSGCVSDVVIDSSGYLKSMKVAVVPSGNYATAYGKVAVHSKASAYDWDNRYIKTGASNWNDVNNAYLENNDGLMHWADGDEFVWTEGPHDVTIQFSNNEVYLNSSTPIDLYIYLWTRSPIYGIYTDGLISHLTVGNGAIKEGSTVVAGGAYADYVNTTTVMHFDDKDWYLIEDNSTAVDAGTVTLLAKECVGASQYNSGGSFVEYSQSTVKTAVDNWYRDHITADAKTAVSGGEMFLLTNEQATTIKSVNADVLKCTKASGAYANFWWLCSQGGGASAAALVNGESGGAGMAL